MRKEKICLLANKPEPKFKRNQLCPCKSGVKWKKCCGIKRELAKAEVLKKARAEEKEK